MSLQQGDYKWKAISYVGCIKQNRHLHDWSEQQLAQSAAMVFLWISGDRKIKGARCSVTSIWWGKVPWILSATCFQCILDVCAYCKNYCPEYLSHYEYQLHKNLWFFNFSWSFSACFPFSLSLFYLQCILYIIRPVVIPMAELNLFLNSYSPILKALKILFLTNYQIIHL